MLRVSQAYFDVLLAEYELRTVEAQKAATAEQLAQAKRNFEVGTATITDTYDAQARFDLIVAREIATRNDIEVKMQRPAEGHRTPADPAEHPDPRPDSESRRSPTTWRSGWKRPTRTASR